MTSETVGIVPEWINGVGMELGRKNLGPESAHVSALVYGAADGPRFTLLDVTQCERQDPSL